MGKIESAQLAVLGDLAKKVRPGGTPSYNTPGYRDPLDTGKGSLDAKNEISAAGFLVGASGPRVRVITACPGNLVCRDGIINAQEFGRRLDSGYAGEIVPHKFKIAVAGCPNCCTKPRENDIGFCGMAEPRIVPENCIVCKKCETTCREGAIIFSNNKMVFDPALCISCGDCISGCQKHALTLKRSGLAVYIGGKMGRHPVLGMKIAEFIDEGAAIGFLDRTLAFYRGEGISGERLADTIRRIGKRKAIREILGK